MKVETYPDREFLFLKLADIMAGQLADFLRRDGRASLCVPGGTTPGPIFDTLSGVELDWENVSVFLNDERWVPEDSERSNTRLLRQRLIRGRAVNARLVPLYAPAPTPEEALDGLAAGLKPHLPISVLLLGMGTDILVPMRAEAAGEPRVTLSAHVLRAAFNIHILITGAEKRSALERAAGMDVLDAPVRAVLDNATVHWAE
jgi:6-phosphogluconolactonase